MIHFLAPAYLYGLLLLAIPVIIHLFNFRRFKKVLFTNVRFLRELQEETTRTSRLKHLLILLARLLAMACLILAFAQPVFNSGGQLVQIGNDPVSIYLDNSFSMDAVGPQGRLLDVARKKAAEIVRSFPPSANFQLLTSEFNAASQRLLSRDEILAELDKVQSSPSSRSLNEIVIRQKEALSVQQPENFRSYIISDFQQSCFPLNEQVAQDSALDVTLVALPLQETGNLYVDSCWLNSPIVQLGSATEFSVKVINSSADDVENVPVRLIINGKQKAVSGLSLSAGQSSIVNFNFTIQEPGWQNVEARINDSPVTFDDSYFVSFEVKEKLNVLAIFYKNASPFTQALFGSNANFQFKTTSAGNVDYSLFKDQQLLVLENTKTISSGFADELKKYLGTGGTVCVFPDSTAGTGGLNDFFASIGVATISSWRSSADKVKKLEWSNPLFLDVFDKSGNNGKNLDLPALNASFEWAVNSKSASEVLMELESGQPFLTSTKAGEGELYVFSVPLMPGVSNFPTHSIFAPLLFRMALLGARPFEFSNTIGLMKPVTLNAIPPAGDETFHLIDEASETDVIPRVRPLASAILLDPGDQIKSAGHYQLKRGESTFAVLSFNFNRKESDMKFSSESELENFISNISEGSWQLLSGGLPELTKQLTAMHSGVPLWKYVILLSLLFFLVEILLIRFWKTS